MVYVIQRSETLSSVHNGGVIQNSQLSELSQISIPNWGTHRTETLFTRKVKNQKLTSNLALQPSTCHFLPRDLLMKTENSLLICIHVMSLYEQKWAEKVDWNGVPGNWAHLSRLKCVPIIMVKVFTRVLYAHILTYFLVFDIVLFFFSGWRM